MSDTALLDIHDLKHRYTGELEHTFPDWQIQRGQHHLLLGPSGCGKTTLLHLLAGLLTPDSGAICIQGCDIGKLSESRRDRFRAENIGIIFQRLHLLSALTVRQNLQIARQLAGKKPDTDAVSKTLEALDIADLAERRPDSLSQGQAQRVAVARALVNRPALILADEPSAALDDQAAERVIALLQQQAEHYGSTLVVATHDQRVCEHFTHQLQLNS